MVNLGHLRIWFACCEPQSILQICLQGTLGQDCVILNVVTTLSTQVYKGILIIHLRHVLLLQWLLTPRDRILVNRKQPVECSTEGSTYFSLRTSKFRVYIVYSHLSTSFEKSQLLLIPNQVQSKKEHDETVATVSKHDGKQERECDDSEESCKRDTRTVAVKFVV